MVPESLMHLCGGVMVWWIQCTGGDLHQRIKRAKGNYFPEVVRSPSLFTHARVHAWVTKVAVVRLGGCGAYRGCV